MNGADCSIALFETREKDDPVAKMLFDLFRPAGFGQVWGMKAHEVPPCNLIGAVFIESFTSFVTVGQTCGACDVTSFGGMS